MLTSNSRANEIAVSGKEDLDVLMRTTVLVWSPLSSMDLEVAA